MVLGFRTLNLTLRFEIVRADRTTPFVLSTFDGLAQAAPGPPEAVRMLLRAARFPVVPQGQGAPKGHKQFCKQFWYHRA